MRPCIIKVWLMKDETEFFFKLANNPNIDVTIILIS